MFRKLLRSPYARRRLALAALTLGLTALPLVGTLGYENALVLAPVVSVISSMIGIDAVGRARREHHGLARVAAVAASELAWAHLVVLAVLLVGRLWQRGCDPWGGLQFYLLGPGVSSVAGVCCGVWGGLLARRRWRQVAVALSVPSGCLLVGLWRLYRHPVVFAYDPFWGYFSGSLYDEAISVGWTYVGYRAYNLWAVVVAGLAAWAWAIPGPLTVARPAVSGRAGLVTAAVVANAVGVAWVGLRADRFGFTATAASITRELTGTLQTEHFVIHYVPRSANARLLDVLATEHEFAWARLAEKTGLHPQRPVESFLFDDADQKRRLMGAGVVQVAAPWRHQIYLDHRGFPHAILPHELAHVFGAEVGDPLLGIARRGLRVNMGLVEGFATALAPRAADRLDLHDQVRVLARLDRRPPLSAVMGPGFFTQASRVAYTVAGSFCQWLIDTRGFDSMAKLYRSAGDFEDAYGESLTTLETRWLAFLDGYEGITDADVDAQAQRFRRTSVFARPCAHRVAEVQMDIQRAQGQGRLEDAVERQRDLCRLEPGEPVHALSLADGLARARRYDEALSTLEHTEAQPDLTVSIQASAAELKGDIAMVEGRRNDAAVAYARALEHPLYAASRRVLQLKRRAAEDPSIAPVIVRYFALFENDDDGFVRAIVRLHAATVLRDLPGYEGLGAYLMARQLLGVQEVSAAHQLLVAALERPGGLPSPDFVRAAREELLATSVALGRSELARRTLADLRAAPDLGHGDRLELDDWAARIDFFEREHRPPA